MAAALGLSEIRGDVVSACLTVLGGSQQLLVLDNCEHLLEGVRELVVTVLDACPELGVLATSREPLGLPTECPYRLAPLRVPRVDPAGENGERGLEHNPAVAVFLDRAARIRPGLAPGPPDLRVIADIVRRLDGIPLAIELAAGRMSTFSLADLSARLDRALDLLGDGRPRSDARHRTLRSTVQWSYDLLDERERELFRHLAAFPDGVGLAAAEYVAADLGLGGEPGSALARLVDASLLNADFENAGSQGPPRYRMLETIRAFGAWSEPAWRGHRTLRARGGASARAPSLL